LLHSAGSKPAARAAANSGKRAGGRAVQTDPDIDLIRAFADVAPLPSRNRARIDKARPPPTPAKRLADEADALAASKFGTESSPSSWEIGQEQEAQQTFLRPGLGADVLVRLRRGHWSVQGELDLHRLTSNEAHDALADFLFDARGRGLRCVRVIHGKGLSSPNREPVLKSKVRRWLSQWDEVLAYCEAPRHGGGGGAVVVLLKAPPA
jgi:DNA-nicking Smr family endonuclease